MSKNDDGDQQSGQGKSIDLTMDRLDPEEALRGFMEVNPEKVKERLEQESDPEAQDA